MVGAWVRVGGWGGEGEEGKQEWGLREGRVHMLLIHNLTRTTAHPQHPTPLDTPSSC